MARWRKCRDGRRYLSKLWNALPRSEARNLKKRRSEDDPWLMLEASTSALESSLPLQPVPLVNISSSFRQSLQKVVKERMR